MQKNSAWASRFRLYKFSFSFRFARSLAHSLTDTHAHTTHSRALHTRHTPRPLGRATHHHPSPLSFPFFFSFTFQLSASHLPPPSFPASAVYTPHSTTVCLYARGLCFCCFRVNVCVYACSRRRLFASSQLFCFRPFS